MYIGTNKTGPTVARDLVISPMYILSNSLKRFLSSPRVYLINRPDSVTTKSHAISYTDLGSITLTRFSIRHVHHTKRLSRTTITTDSIMFLFDMNCDRICEVI